MSRAILAFTLFVAGVVAAQSAASAPVATRAAFGPGERAEYDVHYGPLRVGEASLSVLAIDTLRGHDVYRFQLTIAAGVNLLLYKYKLRDTLESWADTATLATRRFVQRQRHQGGLRDKRYDVFPERRTFADGDRPEEPSVADPIDDLGFLFLARRLPLDVGSTIEIPRYFKPATNPVTLVVIGRDTIEAAGRRWSTIVIRPIIKTSTMFSDGEGRVWLSDDLARVVVQLKAKASIGSITMKLRSYSASSP